MDIYLVVFDRKAISLSKKLFTEINHYIDTYYEDSDEFEVRSRQNRVSHEFDQIYNANSAISAKRDLKKTKKLRKEPSVESDQLEKSLFEQTTFKDSLCYSIPESTPRSLEDVINQIDETFSEMLFRLIDEKGKADVEVYKRANIDRKLFSKMRNKEYQPKKVLR